MEMKSILVYVTLLIASLLLVSETAEARGPTVVQFQSQDNPELCAAGKSAWATAIGSGPFHLERCRRLRGEWSMRNVT